jgi:hypothetical protein
MTKTNVNVVKRRTFLENVLHLVAEFIVWPLSTQHFIIIALVPSDYNVSTNWVLSD